MSHRRKLIIGFASIVAVLVLFYVTSSLGTSFERFTVTETEINGTAMTCEHYTERCTCYGIIIVNSTYPPQYGCEGYLRCEQIDRRECRPQP